MKKLLLSSTALLATLTLAACSTNAVVVETKDGNITQEELYNSLKAQYGKQAVQNLVVEKVVRANVKDKAAIDKEVDQFVADSITQAGGADKFNALLQQRNFATQEDFKKAVFVSRAINAIVKEKTDLSDSELEKYYETWSPKITASHILVADEESAKAIIEELKNGGDWNTIAKEKSIDTGTKEKGGSLGSFDPSTMVKEFAQAAQAMKDGEVSQTPVKTSFGYHIIKVESNPGKTTFEADKDKVKEAALDAKLKDNAYIQTVIAQLVKDANVKITDKSLSTALDSLLGTTSETSESTTTTAK